MKYLSKYPQITKGPGVGGSFYSDKTIWGLICSHQTIHHQSLLVAEFSRLGKYKDAYLTKYSVLGTINLKMNDNNSATNEPGNRLYRETTEPLIGTLVC